mgnify:FL=1
MHYMTNYFEWYFVDRYLADGTRCSSLWRSEVPLGDLCLYMPDPSTLFTQVDEDGNLDGNARQLLSCGEFLQEEQSDKTIPARFLDMIDLKLADVLHNEVCLDGERTDGVGRLMYAAILRAFQAARGELPCLSEEEVAE